MATKQVTDHALRLLIEKAQNQETITYEDLAISLGLPSSGNALGKTLGVILGEVNEWSMKRGQPYLTSLVIRKSGEDQGLPGRGFWEMILPGHILSASNRSARRSMLTVLHSQVFNYYKI